ncbi:MAG TPA: AMP-binding protein, partial [Candidatus Binatia bacterium]|nr:AMP-binding protein [Candidatus Binatia bacterium]
MELLRAQEKRAPDAVVLSAPGRADLTYGELVEQVESTVAFLRSRGVGSGERVALMLPNGPEMAAAFLAVSAGAVCAPLNSAYPRRELEIFFGDLNPPALVLQPGLNPVAVEIARARNISILELQPKAEAAAGVFGLTGGEQLIAGCQEPPQPHDLALLLHTSGTTSTAKLVPLTHHNLMTSAQNIARTLCLTQQDRCLNVMPLFHIHGLVGALLSSLMAGASVICTPGFDPDQFFSWLEILAPTWYSAVPTVHYAVLDRAESERFSVPKHSLRFIRSSSSALPAGVMARLEKLFHVPVIEAYGMTEAAHQIASNPLPPEQRKAGSVGRAAGPEISVRRQGDEAPHGEVGEIAIRGDSVTAGYLDNPGANNESFEDHWLKTGDQGYIDRDGYLFITGRLKEMINRGGEKIAPREIEEILLVHPAVTQAVAFAMRHETLGEEVAAAVVLGTAATITERELRKFVGGHLAAFKVPKRILFVDEIPKTASGKPQRIGLAEIFGPLLENPPLGDFLAPRNQVEEVLADIWSKVLGVDRVGRSDSFFDLGGDSLRAMQVISRVRDVFGTEVPYATFFDAPTVAELAMCI